MAARKIDHVDIVAHAGAVGRVVIVAEDVEMIAAADRHLRDEGHEVVGDAARVLADESAAVRADGVEVAQQADGKVLHRLGGVAQDLLGHVLRPAVGVGAHAGAGALPEGHLVVAGVDRRRGGEDDVLHAVVAHGLAEAHGGEEIVVVVFQRHRHGLADGLEPGEVDRAVDAVLFKNAVERRTVAHVVLIEGHVLAGDLLYAFDGLDVGVDQIVDDDDIVAAFKQLHAGVAADIAGAAGDEYVHASSPFNPAVFRDKRLSRAARRSRRSRREGLLYR